MLVTGAKCARPRAESPLDDEGGGVLLGELSLSVDLEAVRAGREFVRRTLGMNEVAAGVVDDAALIVSELLTNVELHCSDGTQPRATVRLVAVVAILRIEVHDASPLALAQRVPGDDDEHGRGLLVIDALADRWGWLPTSDGKCVWCELTAWPEQTPSHRA